MELAVSEVREILDAAGAGDADFSGDVRVIAAREPLEVSADSEIAAAVRRAATAVLGAPPDVVGETFWADSALLAAAGIPTVLFGPIGEGAHAEVEWVDVASLEQCVEIYTGVAAELCA
jgi:acetylornithine deacetylase